MTQEQIRMQMLAGIITESQYKSQLNEYDSSFNAHKKYMETPIELIDMVEKEYKVSLDDAIYLFFDRSVSLDDMGDPEDQDIFKDITLGKKENPSNPIRTDRSKWFNKELFDVIQKLDFIDSAEKIKDVLEFYYNQPFNMEDYFTTDYFDSLEEAKEEWENHWGKQRILNYEEYKQLFDIYGPNDKYDAWV